MKLRIYDEKNDREKSLILKLEYADNGSVLLVAVDEKGNTLTAGNILRITNEGYLEKAKNINPKIPVVRNALDGSIIEIEV